MNAQATDIDRGFPFMHIGVWDSVSIHLTSEKHSKVNVQNKNILALQIN